MAYRTPEEKVFEYTRRRYDGGPEIEAIQFIEWQIQMLEQQQQMGAMQQPQSPSPVPVMAGSVPSPTMMPQPFGMGMLPEMMSSPAPMALGLEASSAMPYSSVAPIAPMVPPTLGGKVTKAFVLPYLELFLGCIGILTCVLMKLSVIKGAHPTVGGVDAERQALMIHSKNVVQTSLRDIRLAPIRFLQLCLL